jgi:hypothetical protein
VGLPTTGEQRGVMNLFLLMLLLLLTTMPVDSANTTLKQQAACAIKAFFQVIEPIAEFEGHYVNTPPEFGQTCRVRLDFSEPGAEYFTISGEYTPSTSIGDGIYFDASDDTFVTVTTDNATLIIEQHFRDNFSTGTRTHMRLHKQPGAIEVTICEVSRFLLFSSTQVKHCVIPLE